MTLTKLSNYYPYLFDKNIALIKIDIEGCEEKAMKSGIELISKYHVPFIVTELHSKALTSHGTDPKKYVKMYLDNGYKVSMKDFFPDKYDTLETVSKQSLTNLFFVYKEYAK